ncbi:MAG: hypothetical protein HY559_06890 [Gammaproteobacteria bacterium]|nr:hypothetical protein [Gammaproteobacteria bacterium]
MLTSCGFHLRNTPEIPAHFYSIELKSKTPYAPLEIALKRKFSAAASLRSKTKPEESQAVVVEILDSSVSARPRAIRGDKRLEEIEVTYQATFQVLGLENKVIMPPLTLSRSESVLYDRSFALGKQYEREELEHELAAELVDDILYRLALARPEKI